MIQPNEMKTELPVSLSGGVKSTTTKVWEILSASYKGDIDKVKELFAECEALIYAQYNYTPPIHFAVREGHVDLVSFLLVHGALDPSYKIYPFSDDLVTIAQDREYHEIVWLLQEYVNNPSLQKHKGDNGEVHYDRNNFEKEFEHAVEKENMDKVKDILENHPEFALDETYFWGEGILTFAAKYNNRPLIDLLMSYGAKVPTVLKWAQFYYFEHNEGAAYMMEKGMNPNTMSWQEVTILHDMAQKGNIPKAGLLIKSGALIDPVDEEYQSTPLGMAARWGHTEMVGYLLKQGADPNKSGSIWSTPLAWSRKKGYNDIEKILIDAGATQ